MALTPFSRIRTDDKDLMSVQDSLRELLDPLIKIPFLDGVLLKDVILPAGTTQNVDHKLNRAFQGFIVTTKDVPYHIYQHENQPDPTKFIRLATDAPGLINVIFDVWVF